MAATANAPDFLRSAKVVIDVRTPAEFRKGHVPGAVNIPLFTDEERVVIGTLYKQEGREAAIEQGLKITGPRLHEYIQQAKALGTSHLHLHCWRGGMRSASMAWLFNLYGFRVTLLEGGYKAFRNHVLTELARPLHLFVLGGKTGSGKTAILGELEKIGEQVIDLEKLAHHKGSSFGSLGESPQCSQEQFENDLWKKCAEIDPSRPCWIENESRKIGINVLPDPFYQALKKAPVIHIELPDSERIRYLVKEYGKFSSEELIVAVTRITKHLGGQHAKAATDAIRNGDLDQACRMILVYYDKTYGYEIAQRGNDNVHTMHEPTLDPDRIARKLASFIRTL